MCNLQKLNCMYQEPINLASFKICSTIGEKFKKYKIDRSPSASVSPPLSQSSFDLILQFEIDMKEFQEEAKLGFKISPLKDAALCLRGKEEEKDEKTSFHCFSSPTPMFDSNRKFNEGRAMDPSKVIIDFSISVDRSSLSLTL